MTSRAPLAFRLALLALTLTACAPLEDEGGALEADVEQEPVADPGSLGERDFRFALSGGALPGGRVSALEWKDSGALRITIEGIDAAELAALADADFGSATVDYLDEHGDTVLALKLVGARPLGGPRAAGPLRCVLDLGYDALAFGAP